MDDGVIIFAATRTENVEEEWQDSEDMFCKDDCFCEYTMSDISNDFDSLNLKYFSTKDCLIPGCFFLLVFGYSVIMDFQMFLK